MSPISSMSPPFWDGSPCSWCVSPCSWRSRESHVGKKPTATLSFPWPTGNLLEKCIFTIKNVNLGINNITYKFQSNSGEARGVFGVWAEKGQVPFKTMTWFSMPGRCFLSALTSLTLDFKGLGKIWLKAGKCLLQIQTKAEPL